MLSDPLSVTYNSVAKSLPRSSGRSAGFARKVASSRYSTSDREFDVFIDTYDMPDGSDKVEIQLRRTPQDPDGPFTNDFSELPNSVGLTFTTNRYRYGTSTDIPLLRAALLAFVDSTLQGRLIGGEL
jgi:hypothetical protein